MWYNAGDLRLPVRARRNAQYESHNPIHETGRGTSPAILLRHSAGAVLPNRTYVLDEEAVAELRKRDIRFVELSHESNALV